MYYYKPNVATRRYFIENGAWIFLTRMAVDQWRLLNLGMCLKSLLSEAAVDNSKEELNGDMHTPVLSGSGRVTKYEPYGATS